MKGTWKHETNRFLNDNVPFCIPSLKQQQKKTDKGNWSKDQASSLYLKLLIPHEVESFFDLGNGAGAFPAEVCGCPPV